MRHPIFETLVIFTQIVVMTTAVIFAMIFFTGAVRDNKLSYFIWAVGCCWIVLSIGIGALAVVKEGRNS